MPYLALRTTSAVQKETGQGTGQWSNWKLSNKGHTWNQKASLPSTPLRQTASEISNNVVYSTSNVSDQPAHTCSLI